MGESESEGGGWGTSTHSGPGAWLPSWSSCGEQLLQLLGIHMLLISAELAPLSSAHSIQGQDTRVPLTPGTLRRGELVFHILTQEDPKR